MFGSRSGEDELWVSNRNMCEKSAASFTDHGVPIAENWDFC